MAGSSTPTWTNGGNDAPIRGLHGQVVEELGIRIVSGALAEGAVFDAAELEARLGVSRTVMREALRVLAAKGLVDARPKRGTAVRPRTEWHLFDPDVLRWEFAGDSPTLFGDLAEVRRIVEPAIAGLAAQRRDDDDLARLDAALALMSSAGADADRATGADLEYHRALGHASHNELLAPIQEVILVGLRARDLLVHTTVPGADAVRLHGAVLDAVRASDRRAAEAAMHALLDVAVHDVDASVSG
jgi:GntR family transcriptional regulator, galactonate operon transcriptional repressor